MPIVSSNSHLIVYLQEMGLFMSSGMGISPLSFTEIKSYLDLMKLDLSIWEVRTLRQLSEAYINQNSNNYADTESPYKTKNYKEPFINDDNIAKAFGIFKPKTK